MGDMQKKLKVVLTDQNYYQDTNAKFLSYFQTSFNEGVSPGKFVWAPPTSPSSNAQSTPWRSPQIFNDYLDESMIKNSKKHIVGTNITYVHVNATTIENKAFGVLPGQSVDILLLQINSDIPTTIIGSELTEKYMAPLAELAETIAGSEELLSVVNDFYD